MGQMPLQALPKDELQIFAVPCRMLRSISRASSALPRIVPCMETPPLYSTVSPELASSLRNAALWSRGIRVALTDKFMDAINNAETGKPASAKVADEIGIVEGCLPERRGRHATTAKEGFDLGEELLGMRHDRY